VISIREENVREWLAPERVTKDRLEQILSERVAPFYELRDASEADVLAQRHARFSMKKWAAVGITSTV